MGQTDREVRYLARSGTSIAFFRPDGVVWKLSDKERSAAFSMTPVNANPAPKIVAGERLGGVSNYLVGDVTNWRRGVPSYAIVRYEDVWDGIDVLYRSSANDHVEYDTIVAPGATAVPAFRIDGADIGLRNGELEITTPVGSVTQRAPRAYQVIDGNRRDVAVAFSIEGREIGFELGEYDHSRELVIDPEVVAYSTYLGGAQAEGLTGIAVDAGGSAVVAGFSSSADYPVCTAVNTPSTCDAAGFDTAPSGIDAIVTKLTADGQDIEFSTFFGGGNEDYASDVGFGSAGSVFISGGTNSIDLPVCTGNGTPAGSGCTGAAFQTTRTAGDPDGGTDYDAFVVKLAADGGSFDFSTFLGAANSYEEAYGLGVTNDEVTVSGDTVSNAFPVCTGVNTPTGCSGASFDTTFGGQDDVWVTRLNTTGTGLIYSTYLGGTGNDFSYDVALDGAGNAYVTGSTNNASYPVCTGVDTPTVGCVAGSFDTTSTLIDAFVTKLSAAGTQLQYSTFLGGGGIDRGRAVVVDGSGAAYVTGTTFSSDYPVCFSAGNPTGCGAAAFDGTHGGDGTSDGFVTKINATGSGLAYSTFLGGSDSDAPTDIGIDGAGRAFIVSSVMSRDYPVCTAENVPVGCAGEAIQSAHGGDNFDLAVTGLTSAGTGLVYSTFLGGAVNDTSEALAVDGDDAVHVAGRSGAGYPVCDFSGGDLPYGCVSGGSFDTTYGGNGDGVVTKLIIALGRPDALVRRVGDAGFVGDGVYDFTLGTQIRSLKLRVGKSATFEIRAENDGTTDDDIDNFLGCAGKRGFKVTYFDGANDITAAVVSGSYQSGLIAPGGSEDITAVVKLSKKAKGALTCPVVIDNGPLRDTVAFQVRAKR